MVFDTVYMGFWGFPGGSEVKESASNAGDLGSIPGLGRSSGEGNGYPLQYSCLENPWTEEPAGYSPWDNKELDTTEQLTLSHFSPSLVRRSLRSSKHFWAGRV